MSDKDIVFLVPEGLDPDLAAAALKAFTYHGELLFGASTMSIEEYMAIGREPDCDCGYIQCVCKISRSHKLDCPFRVATVCAVPIECGEHGNQVCPQCDPCTC